MRRLSRRAFLASATALALAGCTDRGATGDPGQGTPGQTATATDEQATPTGTLTETTAPTGTPIHPDYETTEVRVRTPDGKLLGSVTAAIADTPDLQYLGLSDTESLPEDRGMLFVYDEVGDHTFVMREMDFDIDIVYADDEGVITRIHHAPAPGPDEDGNQQEYPGRGQYVLEVNYEWTTERGVETGDVLDFEL
ncbi:DUF192 domain-containing protein [Halobacteriales archaeon QS_1_68_20]|nr:MAG: DUF192 domain-containing protein [Halobacteriales archaeon QS_1_68_20]